MSEFYFCFFCDTIVLSLDQLRDHLSQHFAEEGNEDQFSLSDTISQFVANFVTYERELSSSMALMPKELPRDNVKRLLLGCPACDALIRCYDLIPNRDRKDLCDCGQPHDDKPLSKCGQCNRFNHLKCIFESGEGKCLDCRSKNFEISYLKCLPFDAQRDHCYQHLDYYPFVCQFGPQNGEQMCGQKLISYKSCEEHLMFDHKYSLNGTKDMCDVLSSLFDYNPIDKIDELINTRLNSKPSVDTSLLINISPKSCLPPIPLLERYGTPSTSGRSDGFQFDFIADSDEEFNRSFHYTTEQIVKNRSHSSGYHRKNRLNPTSDHNYMMCSEPNDDSSEKSLEYIPIPMTEPKKRGRPKGSKNSKPRMSRTVTESPMRSDVNPTPISEEEVDLTHRRHYLNWFTHTIPTKFPYFPQKDDIVYYLPYGHELYKQEVMRKGLYNQSNRNYTMRFFNYHKIVAKVAKIDFLFKERRRTGTVIRCIYITLRPIDEQYGTIIHVKYHDMEGVLDFIILKEHYEMSVKKIWQINEQFRSIIDDKYWFGVVVGYNDAEYCQDSQFKRYQIKWLSNDAIDYLSPWDLETFDPTLPYDMHSFAPITEADRRSFFTRHREEWPDFNEDKELRRLVKGLKIIYNMDKTKEFHILQDITDTKHREKILYPVDMKTFIARIENRFYRRHLAIKYDIKFMEANIRKLVKSVKRDPEFRFDEVIAKRLKYHTKFVTALCLLFIDTHECHNPYDLYPNIDDYLETHDVKCYSAKRVHLNMRKKYPNCLPAPHKRLPKRPQSFGDSAKTLKIFKALSNTETLNRQHSLQEATTSSSAKKNKVQNNTKATTQSTPNQMVVPFNDRIVPESDTEEEGEQHKFEISSNFSQTFGQNIGYSSDVSRSDNEYPVNIECLDNGSDDSDVDPDFETTNYYKKHLI